MGFDKNAESDSVSSESESRSALKYPDVVTHTVKEAKPHKCTFNGCNAAFSKPSRLKRHINFHTGEKNFKCDFPECDKAYTNACHLKRHKETHSMTKKLYKCSECSLHISNQHNLRRHYNKFHKECGKLTCKLCDETFTKKFQLKTHMATHDPVVHKCDLCNKSFTNFTKYKRHKTSHEKGTKTYSCNMDGCSEVFTKWQLYRAHLKTQHVQDYKCKDCNKVFLNKRHLKVHAQVHMENRTVIPCPVEKCPRVYYFKSNLDSHIRTYHLSQKFECDICKIKIATKQKLAEHIQKLHMSERVVKRIKKLQRKRRKDAGVCKRSMISKLIGVNLPPKVEKMILKREDNIEFIDTFETIPTVDVNLPPKVEKLILERKDNTEFIDAIKTLPSVDVNLPPKVEELILKGQDSIESIDTFKTIPTVDSGV